MQHGGVGLPASLTPAGAGGHAQAPGGNPYRSQCGRAASWVRSPPFWRAVLSRAEEACCWEAMLTVKSGPASHSCGLFVT